MNGTIITGRAPHLDRSALRMRSNRELIELAREAPTPELAVVLAERLARLRSTNPLLDSLNY